MQDLRVKNQFTEHKELKAAQGVKIAAKELEKTIAGLLLRVANSTDEVDILRQKAERDLSSALTFFLASRALEIISCSYRI